MAGVRSVSFAGSLSNQAAMLRGTTTSRRESQMPFGHVVQRGSYREARRTISGTGDNNMTGLVPAASALVVCGDQILLVRSTRTRDMWAFPGGKSEPGETPWQTAFREVNEEVGLDIQLAAELGTYVTGSGFRIVCYVATTASRDLTVDADEILEARWCNLRDGLSLNLISTVREALEEFSLRSTEGR
jgi:8-oxo-dGTP diphosphatase